jgi:peptidoglycan hydrolase CwlO-like protein
MESPISNLISEWFTTVALSLVGLAIGVQTLLKTWKSNNAESHLLTMMHDELERMSEQNTKLSVELGKLQEEMLRLNKQLRILSEENQRLHTEIVSLTNEIATLHTYIQAKGV